MKRPRSFVLMGYMVLFAVVFIFAVAACNSSSSSGGSSEKKMELSEQTISETMSLIEKSVPGCRVVDVSGSMTSAPVVRMKSAIKKNVALASISQLPAFPGVIEGDCGGEMKIESVHKSGNTTSSFIFNSFCFYDDSTGVSEAVIINGKFITTEEGTPGDFGPTIHGAKAKTDGKISIQMSDETISLSLDANISYGVPGLWEPDMPTQANPDRLTVKQASIDMPSSGISHTLKDLRAESWISEGNEIMGVNSGRYSTGKEYVAIYTSQDLVMNEWGDIIGGKLALEGAGGDVLEISAGAQSGFMQIEKNGVRNNQDLDCSGMALPVLDLVF